MERVFSHSGDIGDLLAALPVIRQLGGGELVLFPAQYTGCRMTRARVESLRPLLELQPYIKGVRWAPGPEGTNLDEWRQHYDSYKNLTDMLAQTFGQPHPDREQPWLKIDRPHRVARVVFARSDRYRNPQVDWHKIYKEYAGAAVFVGTPDEHQDLQQEVGPVGYRYTPTYLDAARVVAGADLVVVNQTSIRWLAEGFKVPVLVEVEPAINNTHWQRAGAFYLYGPSDIPALADLESVAVRSVVQRAHGRTLITDDRLENIARLVRSVRHLPGELAELGTYRGGSASVIAGCCPEKRLRLFDTWEGNPEDDQLEGGHLRGEFAADFDEVRSFLEIYDVEYFRGAFPDTAPAANDDTRYAFVHLDADTYQSTRAGLEYFLPRLVTGGVCVLDDYRWERCPGVELALRHVCPSVKIQAGPQQAWFRK
jgi:Macrocin-O-methyltransferase (TylF)